MGTPSHGRSRISARQQQKRERALRKKREKEAAEALIGKTDLFRMTNLFRCRFHCRLDFADLISGHVYFGRGKQTEEETADCPENHYVVGPDKSGA